MLHRIKYKIIVAIFLFFIGFYISVGAEVDTNNNLIDTVEIIQNDSLKLDTLSSDSGELSFYEGYVEPIIAVVFSALFTVLLFSVRSKK
ncbi:MAG: hypothetical protein FWG85_00255 [Bacteroidetes bacterium]|nr:hypothetical protein [Bacteroidota bacterium]